MNISIKRVLGIGLLLLMPVHKDVKAQSAPPRIPKGIYAVVKVEDVVENRFNVIKSEGKGITIAGMDLYLTNDFYPQLLGNHAVAGLALEIHWDTLNPNPPGDPNDYFWNYVDDAFSSVSTWNQNHPDAAPKTIQLIVSPGFNSPQWLLNEIADTDGSCDGLFSGVPPTPGPGCGLVTFAKFTEQNEADGNVLPLPWDMTYEVAWYGFLEELGARYTNKPALVSIAVAGPTGASAEMLLPSGNAYGTFNGTNVPADHMWHILLSNVGLPQTDFAFILEWYAAIDAYGDIFSGLTLVATTGNGLPNLAPGPFTPPPPFGPDCSSVENMDCQAETTILSDFIMPSVGGSNSKATQTSGLEVSREGTNLGINGVRFLTQYTMGMTSPSTLILGGAQFNESVSQNPDAEGCPSGHPACSLSRVQALYNVLGDYFDYTPAGGGFFGGTLGSAPLNYLQIYSSDIQYANNNPEHVSITLADGASASMAFQDLLNEANTELMSIAELEP